MDDIEKPDREKSPGERSPFASTSTLVRDEVFDAILSKRHVYLKIPALEEENRIIELGEEDTTIGRTSECEIQLPMPGISRKHVLISLHNEEYYVEDLGSKNGTYLNGVRIAKCVLRNKDQIDIAGVKIIFNEVTAVIEP